MSDLTNLYQEVILDHSKNPRNFDLLPGANRSADGYNPLCGDKVTVTLKVEDDIVQDISFKGVGCAISTASASLMTEAVKGKSLEEARKLFEGFHRLVTGKGGGQNELGRLIVFQGVSEFPVRVKCATLAWHTLQAALENEPEPTSTE